MAKPLDVQVGDRFGRWVVLTQASTNKRQRYFECLCDPEVGGCGNRKVVSLRSLVLGQSRSCGCLKRELATEAATKHGLTSHELHNVYRGMLSRCSNPNDSSWPRYGGRGIQVCERWRGPDGLRMFVEDMNPRPNDSQLHRKDNEGDYSPGNCEWVPRRMHAKLHWKVRQELEQRVSQLDSEVRKLRAVSADGVMPPVVHEDERGWIRDISAGERWDAATRIFTKEGAIRGNHYHRATWQLTLVLSGRLRVVTEADGSRRDFVVEPQEMMISPPNERHAWQALKDTVVVVLTRGPRSGEGYESDTERLATPLLT